MSIDGEWEDDTVETGVDALTVAYGDGKWVVGGRTYDGRTDPVGIAWAVDPEGPWTDATVPTNSIAQATKLLYANGLWVGAGGYSSGGRFLVSTDATSWDSYSAGSYRLTDVAYHDGKWVAVGRNAVYVSSGGSPTGHANAFVGESIAYGNGYWVIGAFEGLAYTTDVTGSWTEHGSFSGRVTALAYGNGRWLAVGGNIEGPGLYTPAAWTATDPTGTWTEVDPGGSEISGSDALYRTAAFLDDEWVVGKANAELGPTVFYYATDPTGSWDSVSLADSGSFARSDAPAIAFDDGTYVATVGDAYPSVTYQSGAGHGWGLLL